MSLIEVDKLSYKYGNNEALSNISFEVKKGEYLAIVGPNGSGKTTLMKTLAGLNKADGHIKIDGIMLNSDNKTEIRKKCGFIFENPDNMFIGQTILDDIEFGLKNLNLEKEEIKKRVNSFAKLLDIKEILDKKPSSLSGGEKQKAAIASVLAMGAEIIIFDDSFSMIDLSEKKIILELLDNLKKELGLTYIYFTSNLEEILNSDRLIVLNQGVKVIEDETKLVLKEEEILVDCGMKLPFVVDLSIKLSHYGLLDKIYFDEERMVDDLWE